MVSAEQKKILIQRNRPHRVRCPYCGKFMMRGYDSGPDAQELMFTHYCLRNRRVESLFSRYSTPQHHWHRTDTVQLVGAVKYHTQPRFEYAFSKLDHQKLAEDVAKCISTFLTGAENRAHVSCTLNQVGFDALSGTHLDLNFRIYLL